MNEEFKNESEIKKILKENYMIDAKNIKYIDRGTADLFNINNEYVVKVFQDKYNEPDILKEVSIIEVLNNGDIPVPVYIKSVDKQYYIKYNNRIITVQRYIDGKEIESNTGNVDMLRNSAQVLGKIVKQLNESEIRLDDTDIESWYSDECINEALLKHEELLKKAQDLNENDIVSDLQFKIEKLKTVKKDFDFTELSNLTVLKTHGDFNVLQCIYDKNNKICAVLDFVSACKMPITWEIIRSYSYLDIKSKKGTIDIENFKIYVSEIMNYIKLNKYDLKYMCLLYYVQILTSTFGYKQYVKDRSKIDLYEFAKFRTNICRDLYKNMVKISEELLALLD